MGTTIEIGTMPTPAIITTNEGTKPVVGESAASKTEDTSSDKTHDELKNIEPDEKQSAAENKETDKKDKPANTEEQKTEPDVYQELTDKIREHVDKLGEHLDKDAKQELMDAYLSELLGEDKKKDKGEKFVESLAEMMRLLILMIKLLMIASKPNPTGKYSGKDLGLSDSPPEGNDPNPLTKLLDGEDSHESWAKFKDEVEKIENVPFSELSKFVLEANSRYSKKQFKPKKSKEGIKQIVGNSRFAKARVSGRRR